MKDILCKIEKQILEKQIWILIFIRDYIYYIIDNHKKPRVGWLP